MPEPQTEEQQAAGLLARLARRFEGLRSHAQRWPGGIALWRLGIALAGLAMVILGVVLLVLPGPGWLFIFLGLGIWATEFEWAESLLKGVRQRVIRWTSWIRRQPPARVIFGVLAVIAAAAIAVGAWLSAT